MRHEASQGLSLCGLGVDPPHETTLEVLRALEVSDRVFTDIQDAGLLRWLRRFVPGLVVIKGGGSPRRILKEARQRRVSVAVRGHPFFSSTLCIGLAARARRLKIPVSVPGAVSPASSAFAKAKAFFGGIHGASNEGIQAYELETARRLGNSLDPDLPLVVYSHEVPGFQSWPRLFRRLQVLLHPEHECYFLSGDGAAGFDVAVSLRAASLRAAGASRGILLVLPAQSIAKADSP